MKNLTPNNLMKETERVILNGDKDVMGISMILESPK